MCVVVCILHSKHFTSMRRDWVRSAITVRVSTWEHVANVSTVTIWLRLWEKASPRCMHKPVSLISLCVVVLCVQSLHLFSPRQTGSRVSCTHTTARAIVGRAVQSVTNVFMINHACINNKTKLLHVYQVCVSILCRLCCL